MNQRFLWKICQFSVLILPFFPALGELGLVIILVAIWRNNWQRIIRDSFNYCWLAITVWLVINFALAYQSKEAWLGLANFLPFFALFIALSNLIDRVSKLIKLAWLLIIPTIPVVILGLGQLYFNWSSPSLIKTIFGWELVAQGIPEGRMSSVFIYANFLAIYLVFTFILSLGLWLYYWYREDTNKIIILILTLTLVFNSIGLLLANSRNSWLLAGLACFSFALYLGWYWLISLITAALTIICGASFGNFTGQQYLRKIVPEFIWGRLSDRHFSDRPIETLRITQWQFSWTKIQEKPITGWGLRNYTPLYLEHSGYWFGHPHNLFIMLSLEIGIIATALLCFTVAWILFRTINRFFLSPKPLVSQSEKILVFTYLIAFASCIIFNLFDVTIFDLRVNTISWLILAAIAGVGCDKKQFIS